MAEIFTILIMIFNLLISMWNAYSTGYNSVALQKYRGKFADFFQIANSFGLVLSFAGAAYALTYFLSLIASSIGYISSDIVTLIAAYNLLVFGGLLTFSGIIIAVESVLVAYMQRNFWSIAIAIYNSIASIWNVYAYISSFKTATSIIGSFENDNDSKLKAILIIIVAALIAIFLVYGFYKFGKDKALKELNGASHRHIHHH
jgi:hypothetical protein